MTLFTAKILVRCATDINRDFTFSRKADWIVGSGKSNMREEFHDQDRQCNIKNYAATRSSVGHSNEIR